MDKLKQNDDTSPESNILPYEDLNSKQVRISGEKFPEVILGICDNCHWFYTSTNKRGIVRTCPICNKKVSSVPMSIDEVCVIEVDDKRGITIKFDRRLPLR